MEFLRSIDFENAADWNPVVFGDRGLEKKTREISTSMAGGTGRFEALLALACYAYEHPENSFPVLLDSDVAIEAERLRHPLLPYEQCSPNNIELNQTTRFYVISGSNMAGKSTLLRTLGLNALLAYAGAPICGIGMQLSGFSLHASLAVKDSLPEGKSKFQAEMDRLQRMLKAGQRARRCSLSLTSY